MVLVVLTPSHQQPPGCQQARHGRRGMAGASTQIGLAYHHRHTGKPFPRPDSGTVEGTWPGDPYGTYDNPGAAPCRSFVVTEERACGACFKRIGTSAVVASPDGVQLQHYSCFKRGPQPFQLAPVTPYS